MKPVIKNKLGLKIGAGLILLGGTGWAMANTPPQIVPRDCANGIVLPLQNNGVYYSKDCTVGYLPPPTSGVVTTQFYQESATLNICPSLDIAAATEKNYAQAAFNLSEYAKTIPLPNDAAKVAAQVAMDNADAVASGTAMDLLNATDDLALLNTAIQDAVSALGSCRTLQLVNPLLDCSMELAALISANNDYVTYRNTVFIPARNANTAAQVALRAATNSFNRESAAYNSALTQVLLIQGNIAALQSNAMAAYRNYANITGSTATILFDTAWDNLVAQANSLNLGRATNFVKMPITDAVLTGSAIGRSNGELDIPSVINAIVPGYLAQGLSNVPTGAALVPLPSDSDTFNTTKVFPNTFSGQVALNLIGACPLKAEAAAAPNHIPNVSGVIAINLASKYDVAADVSYHASVNLSSMLEKMETSGCRSKWFSRKCFHNMAANTDFSSVYNFTYTGDANVFGDLEAQISAKRALEDRVKGELMIMVLDQIGIRKPVDATTDDTGIAVPPSTVGPFAEALTKYGCGTSQLYICWGGWVINGLNSLFGSGSANANFKVTNRNTAAIDVSTTYFIEKAGNTTFNVQ